MWESARQAYFGSVRIFKVISVKTTYVGYFLSVAYERSRQNAGFSPTTFNYSSLFQSTHQMCDVASLSDISQYLLRIDGRQVKQCLGSEDHVVAQAPQPLITEVVAGIAFVELVHDWMTLEDESGKPLQLRLLRRTDHKSCLLVERGGERAAGSTGD